MPHNTFFLFGGIYLIFLLFSVGCDTQQLQEEFVAAAGLPPQGITRTDANGRIVTDDSGNAVEEDLDDWRTAPVYLGVVRFDPAFPNPTGGALVTIQVVISEFDVLQGGLIVRGRDDTGRLIVLDDEPNANQPGTYAFIFNPALLSTTGNLSDIAGLHRLFIFDALGELVSYGDVLIV